MTGLLTKWGEKINADSLLNDYPRPQLVRENWRNLNGKWFYSITDIAGMPKSFDGEIIVPFSPECLISGVNKQLLPGQYLWYSREVEFSALKDNSHTILHFGAVDQICTVYVNGAKAAEHSGGYWPFSADITSLVRDGLNKIQVCVQDFSDTANEAYGKQKLTRGGIWYTAQSGIWQTVWCETVPETYIEALKITPQYDSKSVHIRVFSSSGAPELGTARIYDGAEEIASGLIRKGAVTIILPSVKSWTPDEPFLYDLKIECGKDTVKSYFGMRSFGTIILENGKQSLTLNGKPIFHNGLLDQGYWSDGMYTPPSDEAMVYEIKAIKKMGFNMLRKHIKIEPLRWYYHCDRLGVLVWQDFVSGGSPYKSFYTQYAPFVGIKFKDTKYSRFGRTDKVGRDNFTRDMHRTVDLLYNCVSLALWVPFNEAWGQFDAAKTAKDLKALDPTRLIDHASGYYDQGAGHLHSYHVYYKPFVHTRDKYKRALALTEFGGYSLPSAGHMTSEKLFGYKIFKNKTQLFRALEKLYKRDVIKHIKKGLCATVYTQVSDVEDEINGIFTYDRKINKFDESVWQNINNDIYTEFEKQIKENTNNALY